MMVSTLAITGATVKLLIGRAFFGRRIQSAAQHRAGELYGRAEAVTVDLNATIVRKFYTV
jgi:hypothetical protein